MIYENAIEHLQLPYVGEFTNEETVEKMIYAFSAGHLRNKYIKFWIDIGLVWFLCLMAYQPLQVI